MATSKIRSGLPGLTTVNILGFLRICRHLKVKTQRAEKVGWAVDKQNADEMSEKVNACIFRVDNNQSVTCLTNNNDLSPPIETSVTIVMNCKCCHDLIHLFKTRSGIKRKMR